MRLGQFSRKALRSFQTRFPLLQDAKFDMQRFVNRLLRRPFERDFAILQYLTPSEAEVFIDVGANRGQSIEAICLFHPEARIEAFEANAVLAERLRKRYATNKNIRVNAFGLADRDFEGTLYVPYYRKWMFDGLASLDKESANGWLSKDRMFGYNADLQTIEEYPCKVTTLDSVELEPIFVKIDVQGLEEKVLRGGRRTLENCEPVLLVEDAGDVKNELQNFGYREFVLRGTALVTPDRKKSNSIFVGERKRKRMREAGLKMS